jgi:succinate-semialdehyde dehydrogenase / glutarate-semialdehyde dehydrogenase
LIADYRIRAVKFAGSTKVGKLVAESCGEAMKFSHFEMGSNDAFIVLEDSDVDKAVAAAYKSRMLNSGQAVINAKRFLIQEGVYEEFRTKLI